MSVSDNFNRSDGGLGGNWTTQTNAPQISSNKCTDGGGSDYGAAFWSANSFNDNHTSQAVRSGTDLYCGVGARMSATGGSSNWYVYFVHGSVQKSVAGSTSVVGSVNAVSDGETFKLDATGTDLTCSINGTPDPGGPLSDASLSSGNAGVGFYDAGVPLVDDWLATGEVASSSGGGLVGGGKLLDGGNLLRGRLVG